MKKSLTQAVVNSKWARALADASWEGCHGCDDNDENMWKNGFIHGHLTRPDNMDSKTFVTRYEPEARVCWYSDDYGKPLRGTVSEINIEVTLPKKKPQITVHYWIMCDEEIKGSRRHNINERDLMPESFYESLVKQHQEF